VRKLVLNRRQFLLGAMGVLAGVTGVAGYAYGFEPRHLRLERVTFPIAALPPHLDGFSIGVLADLHLGRMVPVEWGYAAASRLAALQPDVVVVAGDMSGLVDSTEEAQRLIDEALAPVKDAYGVLGNWDYFHHPLPMGVKGQTAVKLLVNQGVLLAPDLWLAGLDEGLFGKPDVDQALSGAPPGAIRILLAHEPDLADLVRPEHRIALQISGHTHGGQVWLPLFGHLMKPPLGRKYFVGLNKAPACHVYTSRGVGLTGKPIRFMVPPEITLITLKRAATT
jgi:predicted MPP superfamily phosphohydrolase